jgi:PHD/YefM family antitoxin component YafN of YafNO toxin-antitoxin module
MNSIPISQLKQRTGQVLHKVVVNNEDIMIEKYGEEYAVILSPQRYQALVDAAQARVRERFLRAQQEVYEATADLAASDIEELVKEALTESRQQRAGSDASDS